MKKRYHKRRQYGLDKLGNKCIKCGSNEKLEFDHIDPSTKIASIAKIWTYSNDKFEAELEKCQLLCKDCHEEKTLKDLNQISAKTSHGTISSYRYCKCEKCRSANAKYKKEWKTRKNVKGL